MLDNRGLITNQTVTQYDIQENTHNEPTLHDPINQWKGHIIVANKPSHTFRMMIHNINGIGTKQFIDNMATLTNEQCSLEVDLQGITEHCINIHYRDTHS